MKIRKIMSLLLAMALLLGMSACGEKESAVDGNALLQVILDEVAFDTPISDVGADAAMYFSGLPEGAQVKMYTGSGYYADRVALITVPDKSHADTAKACVQEHVDQLRHQFANYIPEEVDKIDHAVIWQQGIYVLLCVTNDYKNAEDIVENAAKKTKDVKVTEGTQPQQDTQQPTEETTEPTQLPTEPPVKAYPVLQSKSGTYRQKGGTYIVDDHAFENYKYDESAASDYARLVNTAAEDLKGKVNVFVLPIPTAIGIVLPDDIVEAMGENYYDQNECMQKLFSKLDSSILTVNSYDNLMSHRDEYLYFNTDYHWNGKASYYAYETWCQVKGVEPYTLDQRKLSTFDGFWGGLYQGDCKKDPALSEDTVEAYHPYSQNIYMEITDKNGNKFQWNVISDGSKLSAGGKYSVFGGADNPITVYKNSDVTDGSVGVVVKESFGNALMPYMVDHYSVLYEIDYRYWEGNIAQFCLDVGATDLTFANNMGMIRASVLVAMLADNV